MSAQRRLTALTIAVMSLGALVLVAIGVQSATAGGSGGGSFKACATGSHVLSLRTAKGSCRHGAHAVVLGAQGPRGLTGRTGPAGPSGVLGIGIDTTGTVARRTVLPDGDVLTTTCQAASGEALIDVRAPGSGLLTSVTGSLDQYGVGTYDHAGSVTTSYSGNSAIIGVFGTNDYTMTVAQSDPSTAGQAVVHLLVRRGAAVYAIDFDPTLQAGTCSVTGEVVPAS